MTSGRREKGVIEQRVGIELLIEFVDPQGRRAARLAADVRAAGQRRRSGRDDDRASGGASGSLGRTKLCCHLTHASSFFRGR
jgi:hypothetical protein